MVLNFDGYATSITPTMNRSTACTRGDFIFSVRFAFTVCLSRLLFVCLPPFYIMLPLLATLPPSLSTAALFLGLTKNSTPQLLAHRAWQRECCSPTPFSTKNSRVTPGAVGWLDSVCPHTRKSAGLHSPVSHAHKL